MKGPRLKTGAFFLRYFSRSGQNQRKSKKIKENQRIGGVVVLGRRRDNKGMLGLTSLAPVWNRMKSRFAPSREEQGTQELAVLVDALQKRQGVSNGNLNSYLSYIGSLGGNTLSPTSMAQTILLGVSTVYACVDILARTIASLPVRLRQRLDTGGIREIRDMRAFLYRKRPNEEYSAYDLRYSHEANTQLYGNGYSQIVRNRMGEPIQLWTLPTSQTSIMRDPGTQEIYYEIRKTDASRPSRLPARDVIHFKRLTFNGLEGEYFPHLVSIPVQLAREMDSNAYEFFAEGSFERGWLTMEAALDDDKYTEYVKKINAHQNMTGKGRWGILDNGLKPMPTRTGNRDSQLEELRREQDLSIARYFGVPPSKLGIPNAQPRANFEQENLAYVTDLIRPIAVSRNHALNVKLLTDDELMNEYAWEHNLNGLLQGDTQARVKYYDSGRLGGWLSANDIIEREELGAPLPGKDGDRYLEPKNMRAVSDPLPQED